MNRLEVLERPKSVTLDRRQCEPQRSGQTSPMHICHVSMTLATGGLERLLVDFGRLFDAGKADLHFAALSELGQPARELAEWKRPVVSLGSESTSRWRRLFTLARYLRHSTIDLVHTHNTYAHFYGTMAACLARIPVVVNTQHGRGSGDSRKARVQFRFANRFTQRIVGVSRDAAKLCRQQDPRSAHKIETIWNGIDLQKFSFHAPRIQNVGICVARLSPEKDFPTLLHAVAHVLEQVPDFQLRIVGSGSERPSLEALANQLGIARHVQFLGERSDVAELLRYAGFFVSSSRSEGISLTLLEAMAVGLPVVATRVGGNPEVVVDGATGRLVPPENSDALANAIIQLCREQDTWSALGEVARQRLERHFDIRNTIRQYEELYGELLDRTVQNAEESSHCDSRTSLQGVS